MIANFTRGVCAAATLSVCALAQPSAGAQEISITDQEGREITLDRPADRIVTIPMPMASTVIALDGGTGSLVGMNPVSKTAILEGILGKMFPEANDITDRVTAANFVPNVEELAAVKPDLVIQWGGRGGDLVDPITNAGMNAMLIMYGTEERTREYMRMTATALGKPERMGPLVAWRDRVQKEIASKVADLDDGDRPSVLYLGRALSDLTASGSGNSYNNWYINLVGGRNAAAELEGTKPVNKEQIAEWDPDIILLNAFEPDLGVDWVYDDPILSLTKAAQTHKVYKMPLGGYRWDPPNQESPLTWMWLADLVHPEIFDYDLRAEMRDAYKTIYGYDLSEADIDNVLWMKMQGSAAGYERFQAD